ncbi:flavin reductase family protein [Mesorhizobium sp. LHD-90]|uniref:flavin reductase family protein n=1 Tax=Mesorhizobium sp. LHD-90 TaxID=3071414 RepID=UPI0027E0B48D|nr:flavin reductase family protein [Mesorhizobium sp. LHD-90]MDQ6432544.1 flavin reductase family protein [Mesorhizobium sp. LHD-90]
MITIPTQGLDENRSYKLISAAVTPRPIAWTATLSEGGGVNLAPYSSFTFISYSPAKVLISVGPGTDALKDTLANAIARREFSISSVTPDLLQPMVDSSHPFAPDVSEAAALAVALSPGTVIATPFVRDAAVAMECRLDRIVEVGDEHAHRLIIGDVVCFHVAEALWQGDRIDPVAYASLGRIGGPLYVTRGETVTARISRTIT